jgi:hypothetical protein
VIVGFAIVVMAVCGALALYGLALAALSRLPDGRTRILTFVVEALIVVQAVIAAVRVFAGVNLPESTTFLIYLVVSVCVLPIALQFATAEPTRWSGAVLAVGAIATGVAVWRLLDLWTPTGA